MQEAHVSVEVVQFEQVFLDQLVFRLEEVLELRGLESKQTRHIVHGLQIGTASARGFGPNEVHLLGDAFLAKGSHFIHVDDWLREVLLTKALLHQLVAVRNHHGR
jgi:hypothetical protein